MYDAAEQLDYLDDDEDFDFYEDDGFDSDDYDGFDDDVAYFDDDDEDDDFEYDEFDAYGDYEGDEFFKKLWRKAKKAAKVIGRVAKKHAGKIGTVVGGAFGGPAGAALGGKIGGFVKNLEDDEYEGDTEDEMNAMMPMSEHDIGIAEMMAAAASKSKPSDAQALGGAITITITSRAPMAVKHVAPAMAAATGRIAKQMASNPSTRPLIRVLPSAMRDVAGTLAKKAKKGKPVTKRTAARVMIKQVKRTLKSPKKLTRALANNAIKKRKVNKAAIVRAERYY